MKWNWQQDDWPDFKWDREELVEMEGRFLRKSGIMIGTARHFNDEERYTLITDIITAEALKTSEIEGEYLNRESIQSSIRRNFGLDTDDRRVGPAERGIANMMTNLYRNFNEPLSDDTLYKWHSMLIADEHKIKDVGCYRTHEDPMQVVSGRLDKPEVYFEAPPSRDIAKQMKGFMTWWGDTSPNGSKPLPSLTRAGIAHLYFVSIHPFEDGNGRIGRALAEKSLAECLGEPTLIVLSQTIERKRKEYYAALAQNNKNNNITDWLIYFAQTILEALQSSLQLTEFLIEKTRLYDKLRDQLNPRQKKVIARMFREGISGFKGGLSAQNYIKITGTSRATATRDLHDLVEKEAFVKIGQLKATRYYLNMSCFRS